MNLNIDDTPCSNLRVGDKLLRKGKPCTLVEINHRTVEPTYAVRMEGGGHVVNTELKWLRRPPAPFSDPVLNQLVEALTNLDNCGFRSHQRKLLLAHNNEVHGGLYCTFCEESFPLFDLVRKHVGRNLDLGEI
jgi:hypothetical protein